MAKAGSHLRTLSLLLINPANKRAIFCLSYSPSFSSTLFCVSPARYLAKPACLSQGISRIFPDQDDGLDPVVARGRLQDLHAV